MSTSLVNLNDHTKSSNTTPLHQCLEKEIDYDEMPPLELIPPTTPSNMIPRTTEERTVYVGRYSDEEVRKNPMLNRIQIISHDSKIFESGIINEMKK